MCSFDFPFKIIKKKNSKLKMIIFYFVRQWLVRKYDERWLPLINRSIWTWRSKLNKFNKFILTFNIFRIFRSFFFFNFFAKKYRIPSIGNTALNINFVIFIFKEEKKNVNINNFPMNMINDNTTNETYLHQIYFPFHYFCGVQSYVALIKTNSLLSVKYFATINTQ